MYGACGEPRGPWTGLEAAARPSRPLPLLSAPSPNRFGEVLRAAPPAVGESGRVSLCVWILLMNKPGLPPPPDRAHTLTPPSAPPLLPLLAAGFRVTQWTQETGSGPGAPGEAWERVPPHVWRSPRGETQGVLLAISFQCMGIGVGGCGVRGGHAVTRACVRKRAGETRGLLHSSDTPPQVSPALLAYCLPPCPSPASRRECSPLVQP